MESLKEIKERIDCDYYLIEKIVKTALDNDVNPDKIAFLGFTNASCEAAIETLGNTDVKAAKINFPYFRTLHSLSTRIGGGRYSLMSTEHRFEFDPHISIKKEWVTIKL